MTAVSSWTITTSLAAPGGVVATPAMAHPAARGRRGRCRRQAPGRREADAVEASAQRDVVGGIIADQRSRHAEEEPTARDSSEGAAAVAVGSARVTGKTVLPRSPTGTPTSSAASSRLAIRPSTSAVLIASTGCPGRPHRGPRHRSRASPWWQIPRPVPIVRRVSSSFWKSPPGPLSDRSRPRCCRRPDRPPRRLGPMRVILRSLRPSWRRPSSSSLVGAHGVQAPEGVAVRGTRPDGVLDDDETEIGLPHLVRLR